MLTPHYMFLLVTNKCIYKILLFFADRNYMKQQMARCRC